MESIFTIKFLKQSQESLMKLFDKFCELSTSLKQSKVLKGYKSEEEELVMLNLLPSKEVEEWFHEFLLIKDFHLFITFGLVIHTPKYFEQLVIEETEHLQIPTHPYLRGSFNNECLYKISENCLLNCFSFEFWAFEVIFSESPREIRFSSQTNFLNEEKAIIKIPKSNVTEFNTMRNNADKFKELKQQIDNIFETVKTCFIHLQNKLNKAMPDGLGRNRPKNFSFTFDNEFLTLVDENDDPRVNQSAITLKRDDNHDQFIMTLKTKIVVSSSADKFSISTLSADDVINSTEIFNIQFLDQCQKNLIRLYEFCFKSRLQQLESSCNQLLSKDEILVVNNSTPSIALNDWFNEFLFLTDFFYFLNNGLVVKSSSQQHFEKLLNSEIIPVHPTLRGTFDSSNCDRKTTVIYDDDCLLNCVSFDFWYLEVVMDHKVKEITFNSQKNHHEDQKSKLKFTLSMRKNCDKIRNFRQEIICSYREMTDVMFQNVQKKILFDAPNNLNEEITAMNIYSSTIFQKEYLTLFVNSSPPVQLKRNETLLCEFVSKFEIIVDKQKVLNTRAGAKRIFVEDVSSKKKTIHEKKIHHQLLN
jgi:hypothetical protein